MKIALIFIFVVGCVSLPPAGGPQKSLDLFPGFKLVSETESQGISTRQFKNESDHNFFVVVLMKNLNASEAARLAQSRRNYLQSLFQTDEDPYFAQSNRSKTCLLELQLNGAFEDDQVSNFSAYELPSTDRFVIGLCNPKIEKWIAKFQFIYCKKSGDFLEVKYYRPRNQKDISVFNHEIICENY